MGNVYKIFLRTFSKYVALIMSKNDICTRLNHRNMKAFFNKYNIILTSHSITVQHPLDSSLNMEMITVTLKQFIQEIKEPEAVKLTVNPAPAKHCGLFQRNKKIHFSYSWWPSIQCSSS